MQWEDNDVVVGGRRVRIHGLRTVERLVAPWTLSLKDYFGPGSPSTSTPGPETPLTITAAGPDESDACLEDWLNTFEAQELIYS